MIGVPSIRVIAKGSRTYCKPEMLAVTAQQSTRDTYCLSAQGRGRGAGVGVAGVERGKQQHTCMPWNKRLSALPQDEGDFRVSD